MVRIAKGSVKLIDYDKYQDKWSPRGTILLLVVEAACTGLFLGSALIEAARRQDVWTWILPLALGFSSGVATLQATLVALHNCAPSTATRNEIASPNASA